MVYTHVESPFGLLLVAANEAGLRRVAFAAHSEPVAPEPGWRKDSQALIAASEQLRRYFAGELERFDLPLSPEGTPFQQQVWRELLKIPYGSTISYGELARRLGNPQASRAVGLANGSNPVPIIIPCHRVIGSNGKLTGYGGGLHIKEKLLALEKKQLRLL